MEGRVKGCGEVVAVVVGLVGLWVLMVDEVAHGAPIPAPVLEKCHEGVVNLGPKQRIQCCPVVSARPIVNFSWDSLEGWPMRERKAVHLLDQEEVARLARAYKLMRELPEDDPRSLRQQQKMHCAYCDSSFPVPWDPKDSIQIHWSWLLFPWHRWFLYFHERILASLLDDRTFALPFWNWDNYLDMNNTRDEDGGFQYLPAMLPRPYFEELDLKAQCYRSVDRVPPTLVDLTFNPFQNPEEFHYFPHRPPEELRNSNLNIMHQVVVSGATTATLFMGKPYRYGRPEEPGLNTLTFGTLEAGPHGNVHIWTGNETMPDLAHMGNFGISGWDPTFYIHHANIDRLWEVWKTIPGGWRRDFNDSDWLDTEFVFYDENADLVRVRVGDAVDVTNLRLTYQSLPASDNAWITYNATRCGNLSLSQASTWTAKLPRGFSSCRNLTLVAGAPVAISVPRPSPPPQGTGEWEEVLVLGQVKWPWSAPANLDVFLFLPRVTPSTSAACAELAGVLTAPPVIGPNRKRKFALRLAIGPKLRQLGMADAPDVLVTLRVGTQHTKLEPFRIGMVGIVWEAVRN